MPRTIQMLRGPWIDGPDPARRAAATNDGILAETSNLGKLGKRWPPSGGNAVSLIVRGARRAVFPILASLVVGIFRPLPRSLLAQHR